MYSILKNVQILVDLLKKYNVKNIVISAGTRHTPFVVSVENDPFFNTFSIVDERSASFFALGMIEKLRQPVAIVCTSGTAAANYVSAANEAFYQQLPLLILTADRNHYYMFQQEEQMIPQENLYKAVCKKVVTLNHVRDEKDYWYVARLCNEALLELTQGECGPVHINFIVENNYPVQQGIVNFTVEQLPDVKRISRLTLEDNDIVWSEWANKLAKSKVLVIYGQKGCLSQEELSAINNFSEKCNCVFSVDLLSNLHIKHAVSTFALCRCISIKQFEELCPDIVITLNGNCISDIKTRLIELGNRFEHWHVSEKGEVSDPFKMLSDVVACSPMTFFGKMAQYLEEQSAHDYYDKWNSVYKTVGNNGILNEVDIEYSSMFAVQQLAKSIPANSLLHIANSNSVRMANYFEVDPSVEVYDNRGAHGIDGSMSAFVGQAQLTEELAFLLIGDLSFFYDMNALWNHYIKKNIRILVLNNSGGGIFHTYPNVNNVPTIDRHIAAEHINSVKGWTVDRGFKYLSAHDKESVINGIQSLMEKHSDAPIILEVFTDKEVDAHSINNIIDPYKEKTIRQKLKKTIAKTLSPELKTVIKKFIK